MKRTVVHMSSRPIAGDPEQLAVAWIALNHRIVDSSGWNCER